MLWLVIIFHFLRLVQCFGGVLPLDLSNGVSCFPVFYDGTHPSSIRIFMNEDPNEELKIEIMKITNETVISEMADGARERWFENIHLSDVLDEFLSHGESVYDGVMESRKSVIKADVITSAVYCASVLESKFPIKLAPAPLIQVVNSSGLLPNRFYQYTVCDQWLVLFKVILSLCLFVRVKRNLHGKAVTNLFIKYVLAPQIMLELLRIILFHIDNRISYSNNPNHISNYMEYILSLAADISERMLQCGTLFWCMGYGSVYGISEDGKTVLAPLPKASRKLAWRLLAAAIAFIIIARFAFIGIPIYQYTDYVAEELVSWNHSWIDSLLTVVVFIGLSVEFLLYVYFSLKHYLKTRPLISQGTDSLEKPLVKPAMTETYTLLLILSPFFLMAIVFLNYTASLGWLDFEPSILNKPSYSRLLWASSVSDWPIYLTSLWIFFVGSRPNYARKTV